MALGFFEALEVSEVHHLCEHERIDAVVIGADREDPDVIEVQLRLTTLRLKPEATAKDIVWELSQLFPDRSADHSVSFLAFKIVLPEPLQGARRVP